MTEKIAEMREQAEMDESMGRFEERVRSHAQMLSQEENTG